MPTTIESLAAVLDAAERLLIARDHRMLTEAEWSALEYAAADAGGQVPNIVPPADGCPGCGERHVNLLAWLDDDRVRCLGCQRVYEPGKRPQA